MKEQLHAAPRPLLHNMDLRPRTKISERLKGTRTQLLILGIPSHASEPNTPGFAGVARERNAMRADAIDALCTALGMQATFNMEELCIALQERVEDLTLVNSLPQIVPLLKESGSWPRGSSPVDGIMQALPVLARCSDASFIRSQRPIYTVERMERTVSLAVPIGWKVGQ